MTIKSQEQLDNLICTMIKIHPINLSYSFRRSAFITGKTVGYITQRYYSKIRYERQLFCIRTDEVEIWNKKRLSKAERDELELKLTEEYNGEF